MKTAATRKRPARTLSYRPEVGALWLKVGSKPEVGYYLDRLPTDFAGAVAYRLTKIVPPADPTETSYSVLILTYN